MLYKFDICSPNLFIIFDSINQTKLNFHEKQIWDTKNPEKSLKKFTLFKEIMENKLLANHTSDVAELRFP